MTPQHFSHEVAAQLDAFVRANPTAQQVEQGLAALGYRKGTPGYRAIEEPVTPLDKAFQIYSLSLITFCNYGPEPVQHEPMWETRDRAWALAADWLIASQLPFSKTPKKELRALTKALPDAVRVQCSHELPPGPWERFPKDGLRQSKEVQVLTDTLQQMGLNRKIRAMEVLEPSSIHWGSPPEGLRDYGTLEALMEFVKKANNQSSPNYMPQPTLF